MAVFPESMDKLDANDARGSFATIENYIRYMTERTEFSMRNMTKTVSAAGVSSTAMYILLTALQNEMSALKSSVNGMHGTITGLSRQVEELQTSLPSMEEQIASLEQRVTALENPTT